MAAKMNTQPRPYAGSEMPPLEPGQERRYMIANHKEDTPEAVARAKRTHAWAFLAVGKPWRVGKWWVFTIDPSRAAAVPSAAR